MSKNRTGSFAKGMKAGAVKNALDKAVSPITTPVAEAINAKLAEIHPNLQFTAPMVESLMKSAIIMGLAEIVDMAGPAMGGKLPIDADRFAAITEFMREYAGEKFGNELVDSAVKFAPVVLGAFNEFSSEDIRLATPDGGRTLPHSTQENDSTVPKLVEADDDGEEELFEKVRVQEETSSEFVQSRKAVRTAKRS